jgi:adenylate cyclase
MLATFAIGYIWRYRQSEKRKQQLRLAFAKYKSPAVMAEIEKNPESLQLGGQKRTLTVLFCDIRGFTQYSDQHPPEVVQAFLTRYFSLVNRIICTDFGGSIDKLMGDGIMAYWGFPLDDGSHAERAVSAALAMQQAVAQWRNDPANPPIHIGIGIHTGEVMIGNVGSDEFMDFTVIGSAVNMASRMESLNKELGTTILISEATKTAINGKFTTRSVGEQSLRGLNGTVIMFEPVAQTETTGSD